MTTIENEKVDLAERIKEANKRVDEAKAQGQDKVKCLDLKLAQKEAEL